MGTIAPTRRNSAMADRQRVICPICGYKMPIEYDSANAECRGVFVKCKGRGCGKIIEIIIKENTDK